MQYQKHQPESRPVQTYIVRKFGHISKLATQQHQTHMTVRVTEALLNEGKSHYEW
jgi:hypothetical protein